MEHVVEIVNRIGGFWLFMMVGAIAWGVTEAIKSMAKQHRLARQSEQLAVLKKNMLDRGMPTDEIERVIRAGTPGEEAPAASGKKAKGPIAAMASQGVDAEGIEKVIATGLENAEPADEAVRVMSKHGYSGEDIARVVAALDRRPRVPAT